MQMARRVSVTLLRIQTVAEDPNGMLPHPTGDQQEDVKRTDPQHPHPAPPIQRQSQPHKQHWQQRPVKQHEQQKPHGKKSVLGSHREC